MKTSVVLVLALILSACVSPGELRRDEMLDVAVRFHGEQITGSGVVVASDEHGTLILTAAHVARGGVNKVTFVGDPTQYDATFIRAGDALDLALMHTSATGKTVARIYQGDEVERMEEVFAVGAGLGLPIHMTQGYTSLSNEGELFFSAPITSGDSGGGLFIKNGQHYELVGIITKVARKPEPVTRGLVTIAGVLVQVHHLGFAVSVDEVRKFLW